MNAQTAAADAVRDGWSKVDSFDGTGIAWRMDAPAVSAAAPVGTSPSPEPLAVVLCNGIGCSDVHWSRLQPRLAAARAVIRWDYRGHGRSEAPADPAQVHVSSVVNDLRAVLDAAGIARAVLVGHSFGVQVVLEAMRVEQARVAGVVAVAGSAGHPLRRVPGMGDDAHVLSLLVAINAAAPALSGRLWRGLWRSPLVYLAARGLRGTTVDAPRELMAAYFRHVGALDVEVLLGMVRSMQRHSAADVLDGLPVPLLCVAGGADGMTPLSVMARMARRAPDGELVVIPAASHTLPAERPEELLGHLERFLARLEAIEAIEAIEGIGGMDGTEAIDGIEPRPAIATEAAAAGERQRGGAA